MTGPTITNAPQHRLRCPMCGNEDYLPLQRFPVKDEKNPDVRAITLAYCMGCGVAYGAQMEMAVKP